MIRRSWEKYQSINRRERKRGENRIYDFKRAAIIRLISKFTTLREREMRKERGERKNVSKDFSTCWYSPASDSHEKKTTILKILSLSLFLLLSSLWKEKKKKIPTGMGKEKEEEILINKSLNDFIFSSPHLFLPLFLVFFPSFISPSPLRKREKERKEDIKYVMMMRKIQWCN